MSVSSKSDQFRFHPTARLVGVTSGKGGVGKSTLTAALAANLASRGLRVVVCDLDVQSPNAHLLAEVDSVELVPDEEAVTVDLPCSKFGYVVASGESIYSNSPSAVLNLSRLLVGVDVVIADLPGGWCKSQSTVMSSFPHAMVMASSATETSIADHGRLKAQLAKSYASMAKELRESDKRRNWSGLVPDAPVWLVVETMALFSGVVAGSSASDRVTIRRDDVGPEQMVVDAAESSGCAYVGSVPNGSVDVLSQCEAVVRLADEIVGL